MDFRTHPRTPDNKDLIRVSSYYLGTRLYITGCGDDRTNGVGQGVEFKASASAQGYSSWLEWQFNDWVELGGGGLWFKGAEYGDHITFRLRAPASVVTSTPGTGNCIIVSNVLVPYPNGTHTVDLTTADQAVPIYSPSSSASGYWNWSKPSTGCGVIEPAPYADGNCHLMDVAYDVHTYVSKVPLLGSEGQINVTFPGVDPTVLPPQWEMGARIYNVDGAHTVYAAWELEVARMSGRIVYT